MCTRQGLYHKLKYRFTSHLQKNDEIWGGLFGEFPKWGGLQITALFTILKFEVDFSTFLKFHRGFANVTLHVHCLFVISCIMICNSCICLVS